MGVVAATAVAAPAHADVIVPPGGSGSICTGYQYATTSPNRYWQTCAWADNNEVYFTVHFGNASSTNWQVDTVTLSYFVNGSTGTCPQYPYGGWTNLVIPAGQVWHTATNLCAIPRSRGAYAASVGVYDAQYNHYGNATTDSLQVQ
ncbi:hypothetical protein GA0074692_0660 [Micromonospora pallida]|uniref:Uncharacterized protein n=1 Tax=Micromonospora pallida TaxID=145854 RepID=A0A1C6RQU9_9ACTN|nr:hypothetical protein [Micromonospora pallida]SCL19597.1 hypothetical protein GA0074692_0660 [Micromonospora pallida]